MNTRLSFLIDLAIFQSAWFACVLASISPNPYVLPLAGSVLVLGRVIQKKRIRKALPLAFTCLAFGTLGDALLVNLGFLAFAPYPSLLGSPLCWIALWLNFGFLLRPLFEWFLDTYTRTFSGFSIGGVIAYYSGEKIGVLSLEKGWESAIAIGAEWAIAGIALRHLSLRHSDGKET